MNFCINGTKITSSSLGIGNHFTMEDRLNPEIGIFSALVEVRFLHISTQQIIKFLLPSSIIEKIKTIFYWPYLN